MCEEFPKQAIMCLLRNLTLKKWTCCIGYPQLQIPNLNALFALFNIYIECLVKYHEHEFSFNILITAFIHCLPVYTFIHFCTCMYICSWLTKLNINKNNEYHQWRNARGCDLPWNTPLSENPQKKPATS